MHYNPGLFLKLFLEVVKILQGPGRCKAINSSAVGMYDSVFLAALLFLTFLALVNTIYTFNRDAEKAALISSILAPFTSHIM